MTMRDHYPTAMRPVGPLIGTHGDRISPLPPPEEIFVDWLMSVPHGDCLEAAARYQIEMIDRRKSPASRRAMPAHALARRCRRG